MDGSGIVGFFALEAGEYLERMDGLLATAGGDPPALDAFIADARALRGSATMARQTPIADVAGGLERVARALRDEGMRWDAGVRGAIVAAVDDLKILVRAVRAWGPADDQRAAARRDELIRMAPPPQRRSGEALSPGASTAYIAGELAQVAAALDAMGGDPSGKDLLLSALPRVKALRGMATLRDLPPLSDVLAAVEDASKPLELGAASVTPESLPVIRAAGAVLRRAALDLRTSGRPDPNGDEAQRFAAAVETGSASTSASSAIVPVASLFHDDAGPHVVSAAPNPPTTAGQRFRMEVVSHAEHLRRVVADAGDAADAAARGRSGRELRSAIASLRATAESFGENSVARCVQVHAAAAAALEPLALRALAEAAQLLSDPAVDAPVLAERLAALTAGHSVDAAIGAGFAPVSSPTPSSIAVTEPRLTGLLQEPAAPAAPPAARPSATPRGADLHALLASGLAGFSTLDDAPLAHPAPLGEDLPLIDEFLYTGRAALDRARELSDLIRGRNEGPEPGELDELFALLDLATVE
jgi:chemotaxis protein histidine kinase CheA